MILGERVLIITRIKKTEAHIYIAVATLGSISGRRFMFSVIDYLNLVHVHILLHPHHPQN